MVRDDIDILAHELADLTPVQLDRLVLEHPVKLPRSSQYYVSDLNDLAEALLEHDSLGDSIARCHWYTRVYGKPQTVTPKPLQGSVPVDPISWGLRRMLADWWRALRRG